MFTYVDGLLKYKDASGQWHEADVIKGESAYQAAVRLGIFSGTESEYYNKITNAMNAIPQAPTSAGTYTLKVVVAGGKATYSWVAEA